MACLLGRAGVQSANPEPEVGHGSLLAAVHAISFCSAAKNLRGLCTASTISKRIALSAFLCLGFQAHPLASTSAIAMRHSGQMLGESKTMLQAAALGGALSGVPQAETAPRVDQAQRRLSLVRFCSRFRWERRVYPWTIKACTLQPLLPWLRFARLPHPMVRRPLWNHGSSFCEPKKSIRDGLVPRRHPHLWSRSIPWPDGSPERRDIC